MNNKEIAEFLSTLGLQVKDSTYTVYVYVDSAVTILYSDNNGRFYLQSSRTNWQAELLAVEEVLEKLLVV